MRDSVQRLNSHLERVTKEKDDFKHERDVALTRCDTLQRDMTAGEQAKAQALEVCFDSSDYGLMKVSLDLEIYPSVAY